MDFLLEDYDSDDAAPKAGAPNYSASVLKLLRDQGHSLGTVDPVDEIVQPVKIFFASRTHSQLSQFSSELGKVTFPDGPGVVEKEPVQQIALASRKNLCINPALKALPAEALNETCLELQDSKTPVNRKCPFLPKDARPGQSFRNEALAGIHDIEDLVHLGMKLKVCPYYSTRSAIPASEVVTLPYPLLLNKTARNALGIDLAGHVVIIDEAHNLINAVNDISSASISLIQLEHAYQALTTYLVKFAKRLNGANKMYIEQLMTLIKALIGFLRQQCGDGIVVPVDLLKHGTDAVNLFKINNYLMRSKLARKVDHYAKSLDQNDQTRKAPVLNSVQQFLNCLANPFDEGKFFFECNGQDDKILKYMLLDPSEAFSDVVQEARSIILAGGTMEPMSDFVDLLFPSASARVRKFSCGHIIPKNNLLALVLASGVTKCQFEFTFDKREDKRMLEDLGRCLANVISAIPDGVVVFFASYSYMNHVLSMWQLSSIYTGIDKKKPIYKEPKNGSVDEVLRDYTTSIQSGKGGLLFAVVGGKMSEGINFADSLGRAVIMIGLPFPNANTAEWRAKMDYIKTTTTARRRAEGSTTQDAEKLGKEAAQAYYENTAMRAVNQSIGRAIRHANDYAAIILIDKRYSLARIQAKLPGWIRSGMDADPHPFSEVMQKTGQFFKSKRVT